MQLDMLDRTYVLIRKKAFARTTLLVLGIFVLSAVPRLLQLDYFLMVDENLWYERSARFLQGLVSGNLAQTVQTGHPGVTTMWSGTIGLVLQYVQAALPGESLVQFADRMTTTPATLTTLHLLRLPLALLSALSVVLAFVLGKRLLGMGPALAGAALMAFEPLFVAHSRVLHHDSPAADFSLLAVLGWLLYLKEERRRYLLLAGVGIALATLSKISSVFLLGFAGLTLLPLIWQKRQHLWPGLWTVVVQWLQLLGITCIVIVLAWPALWTTPGTVWSTVYDFITSESGPHANGSFFMGRPVLDPGPLFYPVSLAFGLTPASLGGLLLALIGLGLIWYRVCRSNTLTETFNWPWASWLLLYAVLFVAFMSLLAKKQERYILPAVVALDLLAGWGWWNLKSHMPLKSARAGLEVFLSVLLIGAQFAFAWPTAPYYSTFYNPLLGGAVEAQKMVLIGRGEGLERAMRYIQAQSGDRKPQVASWYGTTVTVLAEDRMDVKDVAHPHFILGSDYVIFYINQLQREKPKETILSYVQRESPLYQVQLAGIDYAYVYRGKAITHPVDSFAPQNRLVGKASLAGFDLSQTLVAGAQVPLRLFWVNNGMKRGEHFYVRLTDTLEQDWAWGSCTPDAAFGDATVWQEDDIIESQCQLVMYPGTPPGEYLLRVGIITEEKAVIGQMNLSAAEGTVVVDRPAQFPTDEWVPVEHRVQSSLNDDLALVGYDYESEGVRTPGETIPVTFYWRALRTMDDDYLIRLTLQGDGPGQYAEWEGGPVNGRYPTHSWQTGEVVRDPWQLSLPASLPGGTYELVVTQINQNGRESGHLALGSLTVQGREHVFTLAQPPRVTQVARLGEAIRFLGYELEGALNGEHLMPGQDLQVILTWQAELTPEQNYTVFVQLLNAANQVQAQHDGQPGDGMLITTTWAPGEYVRDPHHLTLPSDLPAGNYRLIVGMYSPDNEKRLPVFDRAGQLVGDYVVLSTPLYVP